MIKLIAIIIISLAFSCSPKAYQPMSKMFTMVSIKKQQKRLEKLKAKNKKLECPKVKTKKAMKVLKKDMRQ